MLLSFDFFRSIQVLSPPRRVPRQNAPMERIRFVHNYLTGARGEWRWAAYCGGNRGTIHQTHTREYPSAHCTFSEVEKFSDEGNCYRAGRCIWRVRFSSLSLTPSLKRQVCTRSLSKWAGQSRPWWLVRNIFSSLKYIQLVLQILVRPTSGLYPTPVRRGAMALHNLTDKSLCNPPELMCD